MREEPDSSALMCDFLPVVEWDQLVEFVKALSGVSRALLDSECIRIRAYLDVVEISLTMSRKSAAGK